MAHINRCSLQISCVSKMSRQSPTDNTFVSLKAVPKRLIAVTISSGMLRIVCDVCFIYVDIYIYIYIYICRYMSMALTNQDLPVKPYTCHTCNRSFSRSDLYENHLLTRFHIKRVNGFVPVSVNLSASKPPRPVPQQSKLPPSRQLTPLTPVPPRPDYNNPRIPFTTSQQCYKPLSDLEQFSLSNSSAPSSSSSTPSPPSTSLPPLPFDSSTFYSCSFAQVSSPQLPTHNTLLGNPFAFFFTEDTLSSENALNAFQSVSHYHLSALTTFPSQPLETLQSHTYQINSTTARLLNQYLSFSGHIYDFSTHELSNFIKAAWLNHEYLNFVLHRPTFLANSADLPLLATLAFLGIYCVNSQHSHLIPLYNNLKGKHAIELQRPAARAFVKPDAHAVMLPACLAKLCALLLRDWCSHRLRSKLHVH